MAKGTKILESAIKVDNSKNVYIRVGGGEPGDGNLGKKQAVFWYDGGSSEIRVKYKDGSGTITTGVVTTTV
jgi:hypothetical protein